MSRARYASRPIAGHGRLRSPRPISQVMRIVVAVLAVLLVSGAGTAAFATWDTANTLAANSIDIGGGQLAATIGEIEGGANILVVGTDSCEGQDVTMFQRCAHDDGGERNDVTMLVHISDEPRRVTVVSIPRDTLVPIPECTNEQGVTSSAEWGDLINTSYQRGGLACTVATVEQLTGVDIQFASAVRWTGVINLSDAVGGVDVCVENGIHDRYTNLDLDAGEHTLKGVEALQFLRTRHGIGDGSDLGRISNQQQFLSSMVRKLQSDEVLANPAALLSLATVAMRQVNEGQLVLSTELANPTRMVQLASALKAVPFKDFVFVQYPTEYTPDGVHVQPVTWAADELFAALAENRPITLTGDVSGGYGVVAVGPDGQPTPTPTATDGVPEDTGTPTPDPTPTDGSVALPDAINGTTAAQVTCSAGQG